MSSERRITVVVVQASKPILDWKFNHSAATQLTFLDSLDSLRFAVSLSVEESSLDLGRVIIDRSATADDLLAFLSSIPTAFTGDILFIRDDLTGFLSATGRGGNRLMYRLEENDLRFYLETNDLVTDRMASPTALEDSA